jgi:hypothetical protein
MTVSVILEQARAAGVHLSATPDGKLCWRSHGPLPEGLRELLAAHKADLLALIGRLPPVHAEDEAARLVASCFPAWDRPGRDPRLSPLADGIDQAFLAGDLTKLRQAVAAFQATAKTEPSDQTDETLPAPPEWILVNGRWHAPGYVGLETPWD